MECVMENKATNRKVEGFYGGKFFPMHKGHLFCIDTAMTSLDVSPCAKLENLECQYNKLTSLKLTYHPALCNLFAHWNTLTSINISGCKLLKEICQRGGSDGHYVMIVVYLKSKMKKE